MFIHPWTFLNQCNIKLNLLGIIPFYLLLMLNFTRWEVILSRNNFLLENLLNYELTMNDEVLTFIR